MLLVLTRIFEMGELRRQLAEVRERQDILSDALDAAHAEIDKLKKEASQEKQAL